jgi:hypothetical protein
MDGFQTRWQAPRPASADGTAQVFALDIHDLFALARSRITRSLTPDECRLYFQSTACPPLP